MRSLTKVLVSIILIQVTVLAEEPRQETSPDRPNILVLFADDLGYGDVSYQGGDIPTPKIDGVNLLPFLRDEREGDPHQHLFWRSGRNAAVRKGKWKLLLGDGFERLYDVQAGPGESNDRASANPELTNQLREAFRKWNAQLPAPHPSIRQVTTEFNGDTIEWDI